METQSICNNCHGNISITDFFCPSCGKKIRERPLSTSTGKQIWIYIFSLLFPPLGVWPAIKYLRQGDEKSRKIGVVILILTVVSLVLTVWFSMNFINSFNTQLNKQLNNYQGIGL